MIKLTVVISLGVMLLQYFGIISIVAEWLVPLFGYLGLSGEGALVFITGALVNHYAAIAIIETIGFDARSITILALMCLCAHNLIIETAIQRKTGSSAVQMVLIRLSFAVISALILNAVLPAAEVNLSATARHTADADLLTTFKNWAISTTKLVLMMFSIIVGLTILQRILADLGVIRSVSKALRPLMRLFGLPPKTSFLWIVTQTLGLAYGAAVMLEEKENGKVNKKELDLLNHHVAASHSNIEDVMLYFTMGASLAWMYGLRIVLAIALVWGKRLIEQVVQYKSKYLKTRN
ncbi:putative membrane protein YvoD [Bacteroidia bacterium]|nr:putative membrane protein YvoD [Bacteroidia bacterium]